MFSFDFCSTFDQAKVDRIKTKMKMLLRKLFCKIYLEKKLIIFQTRSYP